MNRKIKTPFENSDLLGKAIDSLIKGKQLCLYNTLTRKKEIY